MLSQCSLCVMRCTVGQDIMHSPHFWDQDSDHAFVITITYHPSIQLPVYPLLVILPMIRSIHSRPLKYHRYITVLHVYLLIKLQCMAWILHPTNHAEYYLLNNSSYHHMGLLSTSLWGSHCHLCVQLWTYLLQQSCVLYDNKQNYSSSSIRILVSWYY